MNRLTSAIVIIAVGVLAVGCGSSPSTTTNQGTSKAAVTAACSSPKTVYLFPGGTMIGQQGESSTWLRLSLDPASSPSVVKDELVEAVIPSAVAWTVRDLRVSPKDGKMISQFWREAQYSSKVLTAELCFESWNTANVLKLSLTGGAVAQRAVHLTHGMLASGPNVLKPGGTFFITVYQGSFDGQIYQQWMSNSKSQWYAANPSREVYQVSLLQHVLINEIDFYEFSLPGNIPAGSYFLVPLSSPGVAKEQTGGLETGDFSFQVQ